uniref:Uncharacterized protein n=1 Tax=Anguilla anguilla TaxID=7936 RepID=A0A0E9QPD0_ANGAN
MRGIMAWSNSIIALILQKGNPIYRTTALVHFLI